MHAMVFRKDNAKDSKYINGRDHFAADTANTSWINRADLKDKRLFRVYISAMMRAADSSPSLTSNLYYLCAQPVF